MDFKYGNDKTKSNKGDLFSAFFKVKPLSEWNVENFVKFAQSGSRNPKPEAALKEAYYRYLHIMAQDKKLPERIRPLIQGMIEDSKTEDSKKKQTPDSTVKVFGDVHGHIFNSTSNSMINMPSESSYFQHEGQLEPPQQEPSSRQESSQQGSSQQEPSQPESSQPAPSQPAPSQPAPSQPTPSQQIRTILNEQLIDSIKSHPQNENNRLIIEGFDFSQAFYNFQLKLLNLKYPITLETHLQHILALSSILLVKPDRIHEDLIDGFNGNVSILVNHLKGLFKVSGPLPWELMSIAGKIIEEVSQRRITRSKGVIKLLSIEDDLPNDQFRVIKATSNLLEKVLCKNLSEEIKEQELSTRFVEPLLSGLFDDPDNNVLLRFTGLITIEGKKNINLTKKRPDITATALNGLHFGASLGFGEVKCQAESDNNYASCKDLLRIGIFSKASIDLNDMKGVLSYQVIGRLVVFYILILASDGLYLLYELTDIMIPFTIDDLLKFTMDYGKLISVLKIYGEWCVKNKSAVNRGRKRLSMSDDDFNELIDKMVDRKRECITKHHQH